MPNRDGTGPQGLGPMTGRRLGRCVAKGNIEEGLSRRASGESSQTVVCGVGRGGRPFGGGRGNCYGGGNGRRGMGRRFGR